MARAALRNKIARMESDRADRYRRERIELADRIHVMSMARELGVELGEPSAIIASIDRDLARMIERVRELSELESAARIAAGGAP